MTPIVAERKEPKTIVSGETSAPGESLTPGELYRRCDPGRLGFRTTDEVPERPITLGQDRAVSAIQFGIGIRHKGYNLFALRPSTAGDSCYVHNFEQPHRPRATCLPAGRGVKFRDDMAQLVDDLRTAVSAALETDEYRQRHQQIDQEFNERRQTALTRMPAGTRDATGRFPAGTFNLRVETRLMTLAKQARAFKLAAEGTEAMQSAKDAD